jgi:hypothetical protein
MTGAHAASLSHGVPWLGLMHACMFQARHQDRFACILSLLVFPAWVDACKFPRRVLLASHPAGFYALDPKVLCACSRENMALVVSFLPACMRHGMVNRPQARASVPRTGIEAVDPVLW